MKFPLPLTLIITSVLFIVSGLSATWQVILLGFQGHYNINLTVLSTFIGLGLLGRKQLARVFALIYSAFYVVEGTVMVAVFASSARWLYLWGPLATLTIGLWQVWVLTRAEVHELFQQQQS